ncbi:hypothetical protein CM49_04514 [Paenibacillus sp. P1XP2]|nr:hypothetical protein CM49_04514 [Paenibacillus sp. P1XP2]
MDGPAVFHGRTVDGEKKTEAEGCLRDEWREPAIWPCPKKSVASKLKPEQEFRYYLLEITAPVLPGLEKQLKRDGKVIDDLFAIVARQIFGS